MLVIYFHYIITVKRIFICVLFDDVTDFLLFQIYFTNSDIVNVEST